MRERLMPTEVFRLMPAQDGGWSLNPVETLVRGLRNMEESFSLEMYGRAGTVNYMVRASNGSRVQSMLSSYFPGCGIERIESGAEKGQHSDWLGLDMDETALVLPVWLGREPWMPLLTVDDSTLNQGQVDPLTGVIGLLAGGSLEVNGVGARLGMRLILKPAMENWSARWQNRMQVRRDGEDRRAATAGAGGGVPKEQGMMSTSTLASLLALGALAYGNYWALTGGNIPLLVGMDLAALGAVVVGGYSWKKLSGGSSRAYLDELLVESKIKSLGYQGELQLVRVFGDDTDEGEAKDSLMGLMDCLRQFDHVAGQEFKHGDVQRHTGMRFSEMYGSEGMASPDDALKWISSKRSKRSVFSAREVATLWHLPLGDKEMASMDRVSGTALIPYLEGLETGALVGHLLGGTQQEVRLPESVLRRHALFLGMSGMGKSTMIKQVIYHKMVAKAKGDDHDAIVVIDPHADLVRDLLWVAPVEIASRIRLLDFGRDDRVPALNLMDPELFADRDRCVETIVQTLRNLFESWGPRLQDILEKGLKAIHEYNSHPDTAPENLLTMLNLLDLLEDGEVVGSGPNAKVMQTDFQKHVLSRVHDEHIKQWFSMFQGWPRDTRAESLGPVQSRIGAFATNERAKVVMGQRKSTIVLSDVLKQGLVLLVSTASGTIGQHPAALMGATVVSLLDSALREQEKLPANERSRCMLIVDEFQTITGADWEGLLAEVRKYGCSLMLATQSAVRLDTPDRRLKEGVLANTGCVVAYAMSPDDAHVIARKLGSEKVTEEDLVSLDPHCAYVKLITDKKSLQPFSLRTLPPPDVMFGSEEAREAVVAAMPGYTCDRREALETINNDMLLLRQSSKIGGGNSTFSDSAPRRSAGAVEAEESGKTKLSVSEEKDLQNMESAVGLEGLFGNNIKNARESVTRAVERKREREVEQDAAVGAAVGEAEKLVSGDGAREGVLVGAEETGEGISDFLEGMLLGGGSDGKGAGAADVMGDLQGLRNDSVRSARRAGDSTKSTRVEMGRAEQKLAEAAGRPVSWPRGVSDEAVKDSAFDASTLDAVQRLMNSDSALREIVGKNQQGRVKKLVTGREKELVEQGRVEALAELERRQREADRLEPTGGGLVESMGAVGDAVLEAAIKAGENGSPRARERVRIAGGSRPVVARGR